MVNYETKFIPQNKAPSDYINVYNGSTLEGKIKVNAIKMPSLGNKLYSFGALSDVHLYKNGVTHDRFVKAVKFFTDEEKVSFTCISGDLTGQGTPQQFVDYIDIVEDAVESCEGRAVIHDTTGNHDVEQGMLDRNYLQSYADGREPYASRELFYSFTHGNDVFIMFGMTGWPGKYSGSVLFSEESLQWLYDTLEANRNKRCFIFEHCPYFVSGGSPSVITEGDGVVEGWPAPTGGYINSQNHIFMNLVKHYKNVVWIHGHTHQPPKYQVECSTVNYNKRFGFHSMHIPALASEREMNVSGYVKDHGNRGYGYVVDVYANHIVLRGRDFENEKFLPIATYCLDTTPQTITEGTFIDGTGTIQT